jgi:hypothetical protein
MTPRALEEYSALRATIRERGTARVWVEVTGFAAYGALALASASLTDLPVATLLPLLLLTVIFEAVFGLHTGVERIGRYVQVFHEAAEPGWEHQAMAFAAFRAPSSDPLMSGCFLAAAALNFVPAVLSDPYPIEWIVVGTAHAAFAVRVVVARRRAGRQREADLERFRQLKARSGA